MIPRIPWLVLAVGVSGCALGLSGCLQPFPEKPVTGDTDTGTPVTVDPNDVDKDGVTADGGDCDDNDADTFPGADEICDSVDNDCDIEIDEDAVDALTWYTDVDGDGHGDPSQPVKSCGKPADAVASSGDCDDLQPASFPFNPEICDGLDHDCEGGADEGVGDTFYTDVDADGYGDASKPIVACELPAGAAATGDDCDDADDRFNPNAPETDCADPNDYNCDGSTGFDDADADGYAACEDCNDALFAVNPAGTEVCDAANLDEDCDLLADDADPEGAGGPKTPYWPDADSDSFGDDAAAPVQRCDPTPTQSANNDDCDDTRADVSPADVELCDALNTDEDCDNLVDDADPTAIGATEWYVDADKDGFGDELDVARMSCDPKPSEVADATDCDDGAAGVNPAADEICDALDVDQDCDGAADEADSSTVDLITAYDDADGDGFGAPGSGADACEIAADEAGNDDDCDDTDGGVNPGEAEVCDPLDTDEDCDALADDDDPTVTGTSDFYDDDDGDGFGAAGGGRDGCDALPGEVADDTDCDDTSDLTFPGAEELCDGEQNDCSDAAWVSDAGQVTWDAPGGPVSLTASFAAGSPAAPAAVTLPASGTVTICSGTYDVALSALSGTVDLVGFTGAPADVNLSGGGVDRTLTVDGADVTVTDVRLADGAAILGGCVSITAGDLVLDHALVDTCAADDGGAIYVDPTSALTLTDTDVTNGVAVRGGGLFVDGGTVTSTLSAISSSDATAAGGGLYVTGGAAVTESNLIVSLNTAPTGAGAWMDSGTFSCSGLSASFINNTATTTGGAFEVLGGTLTSSACDWPVNIPDDIHTPVGSFAYGLNATFVCDAAGCI